MEKKFSQTRRDNISAGQKAARKDPTKRIDQKKSIKATKLLKGVILDIIESPNPLNIKVVRQPLINEIKKSDRQSWQILLDAFIEYFFIRQRRPLRESLNILEKAILIKVLSHVNGNQAHAAKFLGVKHTTLHEKVKRHNIKFFKGPIKD